MFASSSYDDRFISCHFMPHVLSLAFCPSCYWLCVFFRSVGHSLLTCHLLPHFEQVTFLFKVGASFWLVSFVLLFLKKFFNGFINALSSSLADWDLASCTLSWALTLIFKTRLLGFFYGFSCFSILSSSILCFWSLLNNVAKDFLKFTEQWSQIHFIRYCMSYPNFVWTF